MNDGAWRGERVTMSRVRSLYTPSDGERE